MKKLFVLLTLGIVISASADFTEFRWFNGTLTDDAGAIIPYNEATVFTILDNDNIPDLLSYISGGEVDIADLQLFHTYSVDPVIGPAPLPGLLNTVAIIGDGSIVGQYAYAVVADGIFSSISELQYGDTVGITAVGGPVDELRFPGEPPIPGQTFNPGDVQTSIRVVPEPASLGLIGFVSVSVFWIRRRFIK